MKAGDTGGVRRHQKDSPFETKTTFLLLGGFRKSGTREGSGIWTDWPIASFTFAASVMREFHHQSDHEKQKTPHATNGQQQTFVFFLRSGQARVLSIRDTETAGCEQKIVETLCAGVDDVL